jgi:hypothetical protein
LSPMRTSPSLCLTSSLKPFLTTSLTHHFKHSPFPYLLSWPFASWRHTISSTQTSCYPRKEDAFFSFYVYPRTGHTVSTQLVREEQTHLTQLPLNPFFSSLPTSLTPRNQHMKSVSTYKKRPLLLKRKGIDVGSKIKGLSSIWENKHKESSFIF